MEAAIFMREFDNRISYNLTRPIRIFMQLVKGMWNNNEPEKDQTFQCQKHQESGSGFT